MFYGSGSPYGGARDHFVGGSNVAKSHDYCAELGRTKSGRIWYYVRSDPLRLSWTYLTCQGLICECVLRRVFHVYLTLSCRSMGAMSHSVGNVDQSITLVNC
jgi:hypothetical protein